MPNNSPPLKRYDTVKIKASCPIQHLHGAKALVAHILPGSTLLVLFHDRQLQKTHGNVEDYYRTAQRHVENLNVPVYPPAPDSPFMYLPEVQRLVDTLPPRQRLPARIKCPLHPDATMKLYVKGNHWWYGHKLYSPHYERIYPGGYRWCNGYLKWYESRPWPELPLTEDQ
jgi:hypothetical protein